MTTARFPSQHTTVELCKMWQSRHRRLLSPLYFQENAHALELIEEELQRRHPAEFMEWKASEKNWNAYTDPLRFFFLASLEENAA